LTGNDDLGILGTDPYHVKNIEVSHSGGTSNFNLRSSLKDTKITGLSTAVVSRVKTKFDGKFGLKAESFTEKVEIIGNYTMDGQILVLPIILHQRHELEAQVNARRRHFQLREHLQRHPHASIDDVQ
jgi:Haemolymph juvenile hormone binding protein (JHBP)